MAEIRYAPWKQIVIHEVREMEVAELLQFVVGLLESQKQAGTPAIQWVDGVAFIFSPFPDTPEIIQEKLKGIIHFGIVNFARTSYQDQKRTTFNGRECVVRLMNAENNPDFVNLVKFLQGFKGRDAVVSAKLTPP